MKTAVLIALTWSLFVGSVVVARADDSAVLMVPAACHLNAANMIPVHTVLCEGDLACTQKVVNTLCQLAPKGK